MAAVNRSRARCSLQRGKEAACGWCDVLSGPGSIWSGAAKLPVPGSAGCDSVTARSVETCAMRSDIHPAV